MTVDLVDTMHVARERDISKRFRSGVDIQPPNQRKFITYIINSNCDSVTRLRHNEIRNF